MCTIFVLFCNIFKTLNASTTETFEEQDEPRREDASQHPYAHLGRNCEEKVTVKGDGFLAVYHTDVQLKSAVR